MWRCCRWVSTGCGRASQGGSGMEKLTKRHLIWLVFACACGGDDAPRAVGESETVVAPQDTQTALPLVIQAMSAQGPSELPLPPDVTVLDIATSPTRREVVMLVRDAEGAARVISWVAGSDTTSLIAPLPSGFAARAIASHPADTSLFVTGTMTGGTQVLKLERDGSEWTSTAVFETHWPIEHLIVGTRPFFTTRGRGYRLFFAATMPDGNRSLRSVTVNGEVEYQVVGPQSAAVSLADVDEEPNGVVAESGVPMAVHPRGEPLLWRDGRGCTHLLPYGSRNWGTDRLLREVPCGAWTSITPNGAAYLSWRSGEPGVTVVRASGATVAHRVTGYDFLSAPVSVPDGSGVIGVVSLGDSGTAVAYMPIALPLADVANAWQLGGNACHEELYERNAGFFRTRSSNDQLYSVYEHYVYGLGYPLPFLVTTDLLWENFGAAFNGVFILLERHAAIPAFWSFVDAAHNALGRTSAGSRWTRAFAALAGVRRGDESGESGLIARGDARAYSAVLDSMFNFAELKPRGHYTSNSQMEQYFRAMHYLTELSRVMDPAPLESLPPEVQHLAASWIGVYRPFIAPPRAPVVWRTDATDRVAPYARRPWEHATVFPLSWGLDNEVLESTVYHADWPADERIVGPDGPRFMPSGLDVAAVFKSALARSLLADDITAYPRLGPVLDGLAARRPTLTDSSTLYERWLEALAVEWADSTAIPGTSPDTPLWPVKRLQTGLASWATLREAAILVTERAGAAEAGEGGFEELLPEMPRGYVEPAPATFEAIAGLFDALARSVSSAPQLESADSAASPTVDDRLREGILRRLASSAAEARSFADMARKELRGEALSESEYDAIRRAGGAAEHQFLVYRSIAQGDLALSIPDPLPKIADVAGNLDRFGVLEVAVGGPLEWRQIVPYFGRRQIVVGAVYSYYEFASNELYDNERWRRELPRYSRPAWIESLMEGSCRSAASP